MYLTPNASSGFFPTNTKWGGTSSLSGLTPGGQLRGRLSYWRPNFAMNRGNYPGAEGLGQVTKDALYSADKWYLGRMGQLAVDPTMLAVGVGALALGMFLYGIKKGPRIRERKAKRLRRRLKELEA